MRYQLKCCHLCQTRVTASIICIGVFSLALVPGLTGIILAADPPKKIKDPADAVHQGDGDIVDAEADEDVIDPVGSERHSSATEEQDEENGETSGLKDSQPGDVLPEKETRDEVLPGMESQEPATQEPDSEKAAEDSFDEEWGMSDWEDEDDKWVDVTVNGFVELDNHISTYLYQDFQEIFKKNEIRTNLNLKLGIDSVYLYLDMDFYGSPYFISKEQYGEYRYTDEFEVNRNLRLSHPSFEFTFNELYVNYDVNRFRFRVGNQVFAWGTADVMSPTSYFNPYDLRELLFKDEDELKQGIPSFSSMVTVKNHSVELVVAPVHVPTIIAEEGNFWAIRYKEGPFPVKIQKPRPLNVDWKNIAVGGQYYVNQWNTDFYLSAFHGPDTEPIMRPVQTLTIPYEPVSLLVKPDYRVSDRVGFAVSRTAWKFTFQGEAVYSPNRHGVVTQYLTKELVLPFRVRKGHNLSYSAGFNFFVPVPAKWKWHDGELVLTAEWSQSIFFDKWIMKSLLTDLLVLRLQDSFLQNSLKFSITSIADIPNRSFVLWPVMSYRFKEGVTIEGSYVYINSRLTSTSTYEKMEASSFLGYYNDNDMVTLKVRYEY